MAVQRMDNVGIVVDDLQAAVAFFTELGMELEGEAQIEGAVADRMLGLDGARSSIAMMRTPDGHGKPELTRFHAPEAIAGGPLDPPPPNTLGPHRAVFAAAARAATTTRLPRPRGDRRGTARPAAAQRPGPAPRHVRRRRRRRHDHPPAPPRGATPRRRGGVRERLPPLQSARPVGHHRGPRRTDRLTRERTT